MPKDKVTQNEAGYVDRSPRPEVCATCTKFRWPGKCTYVEGMIRAEGWCRFHEEKPR